ncbi:hypothetical protein GCM10009864_26060 [Streptomyces lunalinharesii]|uniref:Uncharacterized protein n=1 Tax=Streptomyces lunalinharesii TaxID=333384 RepID=A0ABP6E7H6_9ACTN
MPLLQDRLLESGSQTGCGAWTRRLPTTRYRPVLAGQATFPRDAPGGRGTGAPAGPNGAAAEAEARQRALDAGNGAASDRLADLADPAGDLGEPSELLDDEPRTPASCSLDVSLTRSPIRGLRAAAVWSRVVEANARRVGNSSPHWATLRPTGEPWYRGPRQGRGDIGEFDLLRITPPAPHATW